MEVSREVENVMFRKIRAAATFPRREICCFDLWSSIIASQTDKGDEELCSVYVPTNHLYIGDIFLVNSAEIIRPICPFENYIGDIFLVNSGNSTRLVGPLTQSCYAIVHSHTFKSFYRIWENETRGGCCSNIVFFTR